MLMNQDTTGRDEGVATDVLVADGLLGTRLHLCGQTRRTEIWQPATEITRSTKPHNLPHSATTVINNSDSAGCQKGELELRWVDCVLRLGRRLWVVAPR